MAVNFTKNAFSLSPLRDLTKVDNLIGLLVCYLDRTFSEILLLFHLSESMLCLAIQFCTMKNIPAVTGYSKNSGKKNQTKKIGNFSKTLWKKK